MTIITRCPFCGELNGLHHISCERHSFVKTDSLVIKHSHYHKDVTNLKSIDVYRVIKLWDVTDPAIAHAIKKLLAAGNRGAGKDVAQDIQEAIESLIRWQEMSKENEQH
jgi:hypothetical protein